MITTSGVHHITLIVKDVKKSQEFYTKVCGMKVIAAEKDYCGLADGIFSLWLALSREESKKKFDEEEIGLNHWAFKVNTKKELEAIEQELKKMKIVMEDGGITDDGYGGRAIFTRDPDNMKVEFHLQE
jgi:glyoxylase I family protein